MDYKEASIKKHGETGGKIEVVSKFGALITKDDLSIVYTPGVAAVSELLANEPEKAGRYSIKGNTIAVVSDGSAVLGLGNIGPYGALPVMEGKALLFKEFGGVDAYPLVLNTQATDEIINTVKAISPTFGGINLEDICAPKCFEIEEQLAKDLTIPVFHDDQHGTAIVILAALINSLKLAGKHKENISAVICGAGAAGIATAKLLHAYGVGELKLVDSKGVISKDRSDLNEVKKQMLEITNSANVTAGLKKALVGADVFIGVSVAGALKPEYVSAMKPKAIVFAMANPTPEIPPEEARQAGAFIVGTGRSDFPNQINNVLVFPGLFRGLLDYKIRKVTDEIKFAVAETLANYIANDQLSVDKILPSVLDKNVSKAVALTLKKS
ncbi:TPA: NAD-dependent malic enzyme [candidate division WWE3 bacterium]|uniref:Malic enzyme n=2 Tax=Katanobacteria TaxID=422282 RepID=A0A0G1HFS6_UNCKA|nr:MAG: Malic enzyme [candidate division WWE3 bacterium GW2011_GWA2_44_16]HAZ29401.1 NAD-dependent malic enzyme [candidate division WWE3 bacterium]